MNNLEGRPKVHGVLALNRGRRLGESMLREKVMKKAQTIDFFLPFRKRMSFPSLFSFLSFLSIPFRCSVEPYLQK